MKTTPIVYHEFSESLKESCDRLNVKALYIDYCGSLGNKQEYRIIVDDRLSDYKQVIFDCINLEEIRIIFHILLEEHYIVRDLTVLVELDEYFVGIIVELLRNNKTIDGLYFSYNGYNLFDLNSNIFQQLFESLNNNHIITKFGINSYHINHESIEIISKLLNINSSITYFDISNCEFKNDVTKFLVDKLKYNNSISSFSFYGNYVQDEGAIIIADMLKNNNVISSINLGGNWISEKGLNFILDSLRYNYVLKDLTLYNINDVEKNCDYELEIFINTVIIRNNRLFDHIVDKIINYLDYIIEEISDSKSDTDFKLTDFVGDKCAFNKFLTPLEYNIYSINPKIYENFIKKNEPELYQRLSDRFLENSDSDLLDVCIRKPYAYNLFKVLGVAKNCTSNKLLNDHGILTKIDEYLIGDPKSLVKDAMFQIPFCNKIDEKLSEFYEVEDIY